MPVNNLAPLASASTELKGVIVMGISRLQSTLLSSLTRLFQGQGLPHRQRLGAGLFALAAATTLVAATPQAQAEPLAMAQATNLPTSSGRYLFGQAPEPDQAGLGYVVLERTGDRVYGALYFPNSSFDCFHGLVQGNELAMTIVDSYSQESYPYSIALANDTSVASADLSNPLTSFSLSGFYALDTLSENDNRMLDICSGALVPAP